MENGALLIDTPGMREFGLLEDETLATFDDVLELAAGCRFNDCQHATEPACAIRPQPGPARESDAAWDRNEPTIVSTPAAVGPRRA